MSEREVVGKSERHVIVLFDASMPRMRELCDRIVRADVASTRGAFLRALARARPETRDGAGVAVVLPSTKLDGLATARVFGATRIAVFHSRARPIAKAREAWVRAAFAGVDLAVVPDEASERDVARGGADPNRIARLDDDFVERLFVEPARNTTARAAAEMAASLALDLACGTRLVDLAERFAPDRGVNVVNYHRVLPIAEFTEYGRQQMAMAEPVFEAQLECMRDRRGFVATDAIRRPDSEGKIALTFDDGYEDNFRVAFPILARLSAPACIYLVTGLIDGRNALWWDRIAYCLFSLWKGGKTQELPAEVPPRAAELGAAHSVEDARAIISSVIGDLNGVSLSARMDAVAACERLVREEAKRRTMLSWAEVEIMSARDISFGSHTKTHVPLDELGIEAARDEVIGSQRDLEARAKVHSMPSTALPRGAFGPLRESALTESGFSTVMTSEPGVNRAGDTSLFIQRRDGGMLTLRGRHHPAKLRLELTGLLDRARRLAKR